MTKSGCQKAVLLLAVVCAIGCERTTSVAPAAPPFARLTEQDLTRLRWIEGTWRGTGDGQPPFFERYRFESPTTLVAETFADETLRRVTEASRTALQEGQFITQGDGPRWAVTELTADSVTFFSVARARNSFRWQKQAGGAWGAVLDFPATPDRPARRQTYRMEPWRPAK